MSNIDTTFNPHLTSLRFAALVPFGLPPEGEQRKRTNPVAQDSTDITALESGDAGNGGATPERERFSQKQKEKAEAQIYGRNGFKIPLQVSSLDEVA